MHNILWYGVSFSGMVFHSCGGRLGQVPKLNLEMEGCYYQLIIEFFCSIDKHMESSMDVICGIA